MGCGHTKGTRPGVEGTGGAQGGATSQGHPHMPFVPLPDRHLPPLFAPTLCIPPCPPTFNPRPYSCLLSAPPLESLTPPPPFIPYASFYRCSPHPLQTRCTPTADQSRTPVGRYFAPSRADALHAPYPVPPPPSSAAGNAAVSSHGASSGRTGYPPRAPPT